MKVRTRITWVRVVAVVLIGLGVLSLPAVPAHAVGSATVTTLSSSQNPSPACGNVTFTATVFGLLFPASPLGGVQFMDGGSALGAIQVITPDFDTVLGAHVVPTNHSSAKLTVTLSGGTHAITVFYAGTDLPSHSGPLFQNTTAATSTTSVTSTVNPSVFGQAVPLTATVSSSCSGGVAGTVQFNADGAPIGGAQSVGASGHASFDPSDLAVGNHTVTAVFTSTDTAVGASNGSLSGGQTVNPADTSTAVTSTVNPSEFGASVTLAATTTVNTPGAGTIGGAVQFQDNGANLGLPQTIGTNGQASITTSTLAVGSHTIGGVFTSSSPNFNNSTGTTIQIVNKARTTLTYTETRTADFNDLATVSATLTRTDNATPIPNKTITVTMASETCATVSAANGQAACTIIPSEPAGSFTVAANFTGDDNFIASTTNAGFIVTKEETTIAYTGPTVIAQASPVTLSGRLLEDGVTPIAGRSLTLTIGTGIGSQSCTTGPTSTTGDGQCTISTVAVTQGPQPVTAFFAGDNYYVPATDSSKTVIIFAFPARGVFVLGNQTVTAAVSPVTFWGEQWSQQNGLDSGGAPPSFKGYADATSTSPPACGGTWTTSPGNSAAPVSSVPAYMGTVVSSSITRHGNTISGNITKIVVIVTAPGYNANPGHPGTGTIIATFC